jgi:hypothetical protein
MIGCNGSGCFEDFRSGFFIIFLSFEKNMAPRHTVDMEPPVLRMGKLDTQTVIIMVCFSDHNSPIVGEFIRIYLNRFGDVAIHCVPLGLIAGSTFDRCQMPCDKG